MQDQERKRALLSAARLLVRAQDQHRMAARKLRRCNLTAAADRHDATAQELGQEASALRQDAEELG